MFLFLNTLGAMFFFCKDHSRLFICVFAPVVGWTSIGAQTTCGSVAWDSDTGQADIITNKLSVASTTCGYCRYCFKKMGHLHNIGTHLTDCQIAQMVSFHQTWHVWWHIDYTGSMLGFFTSPTHTWRFRRAICSKNMRYFFSDKDNDISKKCKCTSFFGCLYCPCQEIQKKHDIYIYIYIIWQWPTCRKFMSHRAFLSWKPSWYHPDHGHHPQGHGSLFELGLPHDLLAFAAWVV